MTKEFNYRDYLKNNPLLNEALENKDTKEEVKKSSKKTTIKELKASIRERILSEMEDDLDEASAVNWRDRNSPAGDSLELSPRKVGTSTVEETETINESDAHGFLNDISIKMSELEGKDHKPFLEAIKKFVEGKLKGLSEDIQAEAEEIDIDIEDDINIDDVSDKSEIEVDSELAGESADVAAILGLLTKAQEEAKSLGDDKLLDQIGNTITYYTRAHVVASTNESK
jgi:hypothetical protein|tara:strand:- start:108 stop:788 length:681 start_codon:yes stop_codon:yes gene_type:complete